MFCRNLICYFMDRQAMTKLINILVAILKGDVTVSLDDKNADWHQ